ATSQGFLAVGAALDLGVFDRTANAFLADGTAITAGGEVRVLSSTNEAIHSVSASQAAASFTGQPTKLYRHNGTADPYQNVAGQAITDADLRTTSVALGDVDNDGDLDLVTGNFAQFSKVFLNNGTGTFEAGKNIGADPVAALRAADPGSRKRLASSLLPGLTTAIALADFNGDGSLDVVAGNLGQANRLYLNDGTGNFLPAVELGRFDLNVSIDPSVTANNVTANDLRADVQAAVSSALVQAGLDPTDVTVA